MPVSRSMQRFVLSLALASSGFAMPAFAELGYLEYTAGVSIVRNQNLTGADASGSGLSGSFHTDVGYSVGAAVGFTPIEIETVGLRTEIALNYRQNEINSMNVAGQASDGNGDVNLFTAMVNAYVDFDLEKAMGLGIAPYAGIGVGYGRLSIDADNRVQALRINDEASVFAWNVMAGLTIPYTDVVDFLAGYRYVATTDPRFDARVTPLGSRRLDSEFDAHEVTGGIRIKF